MSETDAVTQNLFSNNTLNSDLEDENIHDTSIIIKSSSESSELNYEGF